MAGRKLKVVVVDHDQEARLQLIAELQTHDDIILSDEALIDASAIQKITEVQPDLVFMALKLPDPGGFSVFNVLKKLISAAGGVWFMEM
jgi:chemotaxis response regulator CheB